MSNPKPLLVILLFLFSASLQAQQNFEPGFIVTKSGDTKTGWIDYQKWLRNPEKIAFRESPGGPVASYSPAGLASFEVTGKDRYEVYVVSKLMAPADIADLAGHDSTTIVKDTAFLRVLVKGAKLNLYELVDDRRHFYVQQHQETPVELVFKLVRTEGMRFYRQTTYREQLKALTEDAALRARIDQADYSSTELARIVRKLNGDVAYAAGDLGGSKGDIQLVLGAGVAIHSLDLSGDNKTLANMDFTGSTGYILTAGIDLRGKRALNKLRVRFEVSYSPASYNGTVTEPGGFVGQEERKEYSIKQNNIIPAFSALYSFYNTRPLQVFAGLAGASYFSSYPDNTLTTTNLTTGTVQKREDYLDLRKNWVSLQLRAGVRTGRLEAMLGAKVLGSFFDFYGIKANDQTYTLRLFYLF